MVELLTTLKYAACSSTRSPVLQLLHFDKVLLITRNKSPNDSITWCGSATRVSGSLMMVSEQCDTGGCELFILTILYSIVDVVIIFVANWLLKHDMMDSRGTTDGIWGSTKDGGGEVWLIRGFLTFLHIQPGLQW